MAGETVSESWFSSLWKSSRKTVSAPEKSVLGILAFEVVTLMSRIVHLWNCMRDKEVTRLREDVLNSFGIMKLVSEDENLLMQLAFLEIVDDLACLVQSVIRLGKKCLDPAYHHLEQVFHCPFDNDVQGNGWVYGWKKMEKKAKTMERFVVVTSQLHQEMEVLVELEQNLRRMQCNAEANQAKLLEFRQKVIWQRLEVKNLREMSPWSRTYDYSVRLLAKSTATIIERLKVVVGVNESTSVSGPLIPGSLPRSRSLLQSTVHPSDARASIFYSGPMSNSSSKLRPTNRASRKQQQAHHHSNRHPLLNINILGKSGPFKACMIGGSQSPVVDSCMIPSVDSSSSAGACMDSSGETGDAVSHSNGPFFGSPFCRLSDDVLPHTLGKAAVSLHYANIVLLIEKFASSPHLIGPDARDDLYNMLPTSIRTTLRARLKSYHKSLSFNAFDGTLAAEWTMAISSILEWLSPLAHNMVRWHSERNFEKQHVARKASVLLVQTLYFADQGKAEAAVIELLMGLNYLCHFSKGASLRAVSFPAAANRAFGDRVTRDDTITCNG